MTITDGVFHPVKFPTRRTSLGDIQARRKRVLGYLPTPAARVQADTLADRIWPRMPNSRPSDALAVAVAIMLEESRLTG